MSAWPGCWRGLLCALLLALLFPGVLLAQAPGAPLVLDDRSERIEAWPAVTVLFDKSHRLTLAQALKVDNGFAVPRSAYATVGMCDEAVWVRIPVAVPAGSDGTWVLDIDYASLSRGARQLHAASFSDTKMAEGVAAVYRDVLAGK